MTKNITENEAGEKILKLLEKWIHEAQLKQIGYLVDGVRDEATDMFNSMELQSSTPLEKKQQAELSEVVRKLDQLQTSLNKEITSVESKISNPSLKSLPPSYSKTELSFNCENDTGESEDSEPSESSSENETTEENNYPTFLASHELLRSKIVWSTKWTCDVIAESTFEQLKKNEVVKNFQVPGEMNIRNPQTLEFEINDVLDVEQLVNLKIDDIDCKFRVVPDYLFMDILTLMTLDEVHQEIYHNVLTNNPARAGKIERKLENKFRDVLLITSDYRISDRTRRYAQIYDCPKTPLRVTNAQQSLIAYQDITDDFVTSTNFVICMSNNNGQMLPEIYKSCRENPQKLKLGQALDPTTIKLLIKNYKKKVVYVNKLPYDVRVVPHNLYVALLTAEATLQQKLHPKGPWSNHEILKSEIPNKNDYEFYAAAKVLAAPLDHYRKIESGRYGSNKKRSPLNPNSLNEKSSNRTVKSSVTNALKNSFKSFRKSTINDQQTFEPESIN
jgi:hypothetical protein